MIKNLPNFKENNTRIFIIILLSILLPKQIKSQTFTVSGKVSTSSSQVRFAKVTFINNNDASKTFSAVTDTSGNYQIDVNITSVISHNNLPTEFQLEQNYPNPFSASTSIPYKLNKQSSVKITIYDILGRRVRAFEVGQQDIGSHNILWNGRNNLGEKVAAGIYFYRLQAGNQSLVKKMIFDAGIENSYVLPSNIVSAAQLIETKEVKKTQQGGTFNVQIQNTDSTFPAVSSQQYSNNVIQGDTTLNFTITGLSIAAIYSDSTQQIIRGFGAANIVGWDPGLNYGDMTAAEIQTAYGNGTGQLGFTILRLRIPPDSTQFNINVASAKNAESLGAIVFASPWSPPAWMKTNDNTVAGSLKVNAFAAFADHLKAFADTMANNGAPLYAISLQNEPDANVSYESCYWNSTDFLNFCKNNAQAIGLRVMMPESENFNHSLSDPTLEDSVAASHVSIIGGHLYGSVPTPYPLAVIKGKDVWMTEHLLGNNSNGNLWPLSLDIGQEINNCMNAGYNAYVWWWMVRFYSIIGDGTNGTSSGQVTKRGYVMAQYSKFIRPGYYKIKCNQLPQRNVSLTAFRDSSSTKLVFVAINNNTTQVYQSFTVENGTMSSFTTYTTSAAKNVEQGNNNIKVTNGDFTAVLEPSSITTFISN